MTLKGDEITLTLKEDKFVLIIFNEAGMQYQTSAINDVEVLGAGHYLTIQAEERIKIITQKALKEQAPSSSSNITRLN